MTIWMDLTYSLLTYREGHVVGIIRAELMLAKYLHELNPSIRFSVSVKQGFREVKQASLSWLWDSENIGYDYVCFQNQRNKLFYKLRQKIDNKLFKFCYRRKRRHRPKCVSRSEFIVWPYKNEDIVFSCGWIDQQKELLYSRLRKALPDLKLVYTIYDLAILQKSLVSYYLEVRDGFISYLNWVSVNCDSVIYGGKTARIDAENFFKENSLPIPQGYSIGWGSDIKNSQVASKDVLNRLGIKDSFILSVGSFDWKKNYQVLYRAYCWAKLNSIDLPLLVIVGRRLAGLEELYNSFIENPLLSGKVLLINASDEELIALYQNCLFTVLPTLYEGWSLTLPESFFYGKFCICSDVAPLRETGQEYAYYLNPHHPVEWAKSIHDFYTNHEKINLYENKIKNNWSLRTWKQTAKELLNILQTPANYSSRNDVTIYYDLELIYYQMTGIPRTSMLLARNLNRIRNDIEFFFISRGQYYRIPREQLSYLMSDNDLDKSVEIEKEIIKPIKSRFPFRHSSIVFCVGNFFDEESTNILFDLHKKIGFTFISTIFDFTPLTVPHTHPKDRVAFYPTFLKLTYELSDFVIYGGITAQNDGVRFQENNGLPVLPSVPVKWGCNITAKKYSKLYMNAVLKKIGIVGDYILSVGTIEPRKNQIILYDAYLELLSDDEINLNLPQLIICGNEGWRTKAFVRQLKVDERIKGKVLMFSPNDEELDILYQNCKFTCLASFYEGWSLTLPESLNYGKFCLVSDTPSLKETGEDFVDYANPYDPVEWAEKIKFYLLNNDALHDKEIMIKKKWHNTTWYECASYINQFLKK